jgi:multicomponent Na+:H+ antiporter subunit G
MRAIVEAGFASGRGRLSQMRDAAIVLLLAGAITIELVCAVGVFVITDPFDKLHFLGPASALGSVLVAAAIVLEEALATNGVKSIIAALLLVLTSPILSHATARAARVRQYGHWQALPAEEVDVD